MESINDFKKWLAQHEFEDNEIYFLYSAVNEVTSYGIFSCYNIKENLLKIESSQIEVPLIISSDKQKKYFLDYIENNYCNGDVEMFYTLQNDAEKE